MALTALIAAALPVQDARAQDKHFLTSPIRGGDGRSGVLVRQLQRENQIRRVENAAQDAALAAQAASITLNTGTIRSVSATLEQVGDCGSGGRLYGPGHNRADVAGCVDALEVKLTGQAVFSSSVRIGYDATCDTANEGAIRYVAAQKVLHYCDGTAWQELGGAPPPQASGSFANADNVRPGTAVTSGGVTVSGFLGVRQAAVSGSGNPVLIVNGRASGASAPVTNGDRLALRVTAPGSYGTAHTVKLTVGALSANWTVNTGTATYGAWGRSWSTCSASCGGGTQTRSRPCVFSGGGTADCAACGGDCTQSQACNAQACCTPSRTIVSCGGSCHSTHAYNKSHLGVRTATVSNGCGGPTRRFQVQCTDARCPNSPSSTTGAGCDSCPNGWQTVSGRLAGYDIPASATVRVCRDGKGLRRPAGKEAWWAICYIDCNGSGRHGSCALSGPGGSINSNFGFWRLDRDPAHPWPPVSRP